MVLISAILMVLDSEALTVMVLPSLTVILSIHLIPIILPIPLGVDIQALAVLGVTVTIHSTLLTVSTAAAITHMAAVTMEAITETTTFGTTVLPTISKLLTPVVVPELIITIV